MTSFNNDDGASQKIDAASIDPDYTIQIKGPALTLTLSPTLTLIFVKALNMTPRPYHTCASFLWKRC